MFRRAGIGRNFSAAGTVDLTGARGRGRRAEDWRNSSRFSLFGQLCPAQRIPSGNMYGNYNGGWGASFVNQQMAQPAIGPPAVVQRQASLRVGVDLSRDAAASTHIFSPNGKTPYNAARDQSRSVHGWDPASAHPSGCHVVPPMHRLPHHDGTSAIRRKHTCGPPLCSEAPS